MEAMEVQSKSGLARKSDNPHLAFANIEITLVLEYCMVMNNAWREVAEDDISHHSSHKCKNDEVWYSSERKLTHQRRNGFFTLILENFSFFLLFFFFLPFFSRVVRRLSQSRVNVFKELVYSHHSTFKNKTNDSNRDFSFWGKKSTSLSVWWLKWGCWYQASPQGYSLKSSQG